MSNQNYYQPPSGPPPGQQQQQPQQQQQYQDNNPFHQPQPGSAPGYQPQVAQQYSSYQQQAPASDTNFAAPHRAGTFKETDFVPESERGEQREAMEQFELRKHGETQEEKDLETLQREFPGLDGSLVAAIYGDSKNMGASREMLQELASSQQ